ncbi:serine/threonine protein kinase [Lacrimispora sp. NSJ-141]|uniref:non-specific serine/threonine protein kinase n=1 Tax=Lientehia hominis TaxID=2897778 RepID=A0AAP2RHG2_9FIRM|nr:serine/threonine-protein kinase [Lientehia hominis]MCD2492052.1 serine/threonine protein kinase [Lientehia hominis]
MSCLPGTVLGGTYRILDILGRGGSAAVYLARHERTGRLWAVKEIPEKRNSLVMEAELLKKLNHPGLPAIGDILKEKGMLYLVMDYIEGRSLSRLLKEEGAQPQEKVADWGRQLCEVLEYLHTRTPPVIYRDMKPSNVMLKEDGAVVLVDFGTARERKEEGGEDTVCLGTRGYAAPEQYGGRGQTGPETDIYGLGAVMYHLLTGRSPAEPPYGCRPVRHFRPDLSMGLEKILLICTKDDPKERYGSCRELAFALERYQELDDKEIKKRNWRLRSFAGICMLTAAAGLGSLFLHGAECRAISSTYEAYLKEAAGSVEKEKKLDFCRKAVDLEPGRAEAYLILVQTFLEDDGKFTSEEERLLRGILDKKNHGGKSNREQLGRNKGEQIRAAYEIGQAYFYYYEGSGGKGASAIWLSLVAGAEPGKELSERAVIRAGCLSRIAGYYEKLSIQRKTGDMEISYAEYWKDLTALMEGGMEEDNRVTALIMYKEIISQTIFHAGTFRQAGVGREEMRGQLEQIRQKLTEWGWNGEGETEYIRTLMEEAEEGLITAERAVEAAFQTIPEVKK